MSRPSECGSLPHLQSMILEQLPDAVVAIDRDGYIAFWNRAAERLFHLSPSAVLGRRPHDVRLSPWLDAADEQAVAAAVQWGEVVHRERVHSNGSGRSVHLEFSMTGLASADGVSAGTLVVMRDVGAAKRRERELEEELQAVRSAPEPLRTVHGLVPICSHCKQIRDAKGSWHAMDAYLHEQCGVRFTHGICPACIRNLHRDNDDQSPTSR